MRQFRITILLIAGAVLLSACSLSKDIFKMEDSDDYQAYIEKWAPSEDAFVAVQRLAKPAIDSKDWPAAIDVFKRYRSRFPGMEKRFDAIIGILEQPSFDIEIKNLGSGVNSPGDDIKPSITVDGTRLYFASDREGGEGKLDIYVSEYKDGKWQPAVNLGPRINTPDHETINGLSFDGTTILLYGGFKGHVGSGDNYYFEKTKDGWSEIKHFPRMVNSKYYDSDAFLTADGFAVLFTSDREGVVGERVPKNTRYHGSVAGNTDIFVAVRQGVYWQPPINLGPTINTPYAERSAFLHPDGKTLYFSSDGHPGLGKMDVFKSVRTNTRTWTEWSEPINLGKDVNGSDDDWGYRVTPDGKYAFFSTSNQADGLGENDIYQITLPKAVRPQESVAVVTGDAVDQDGNPLPDANIIAQDLKTGDIIASAKPDPETGKYVLTLPEGTDEKDIGIFAEQQGYYPDATTIKTGDDNTFADAGLTNNGNDGGNGNGNGGDGSGNGNNNNGGNGNNNGGDGSGNGNNNNGGNGNGNGGDGSGNGNNNNGGNGNGNGGDGSGNGNNNNGGNGNNNGGDGSGNGNNNNGGNGNGNGGDGSGNGNNNNGGNGNGNGGDGSGNGNNNNGGNGNGNGGDGSGNGNNNNGGNGNGNGGDGSGNGNNNGGNGNGNGGDGSGNGNNNGGNGNGNGGDGSGNGNNNNGGNGNGNGGDGSGNGNNNNGGNGNGNDDGGLRSHTRNFVLKSVDDMKNRRDKWGDLLAQRVNNIFFDFNKWDLKPASSFELDRLVRFLKSNPDIAIVIAAHTDDIGTPEYNISLSNKRAQSVVTYLIDHGIAQSRLQSIGYGEARPVVPNDSEEHRAVNRRVEFRIAE